MSQPKEDRRIQRTRQMLRTAILELIEERGYECLTVNDITDRANVGRATFYLHYQDKEQLLIESLEAMFHQLGEDISPLSQQLGELNAVTAARLLFQHFGNHHRLYRVLLSERGAAIVFTRLLEIVTQVAEGNVISAAVDEPQTVIPTNLVAHQVSGALLGAVVWWLNHDMPYSAEHMAIIYGYLTYPGASEVLGIEQPKLPDLSTTIPTSTT